MLPELVSQGCPHCAVYNVHNTTGGLVLSCELCYSCTLASLAPGEHRTKLLILAFSTPQVRVAFDVPKSLMKLLTAFSKVTGFWV